ncbi:unnamed protein product [Lymnaea stagnalis]|uniref:TRPM-like domain-containing protein n=1 Tax=Lymnaea stagnalis TaxID=6523 RepID=A0AAV2HZ69_LYMST
MKDTFSSPGPKNYMGKVHFYKLCTELNKFNVLLNDEHFNWKELNLKVNPWLTRIIFEAVKQGQVDFVEFFIKENFDMESAFSQQKVHELYQTKRDYPRKLSDVASFVNKLLGGSYHMSCPKLLKDDSGRDHQEMYYSEKNKTAMRDLFIWSILAKKVELSKVLWRYLDHQTAAAMFAYGIAKSLLADLKSSKAGSRTDESKLKNYMGEFTSLACKTINSSYKKDEQRTFDLLRLQMSKWGETSCVRLALDSHNKKFLSTPACQKLCTQLWWWGQEVDSPPTQGIQRRNEKRRANEMMAEPETDNK